MKLETLNHLPQAEARAAFERCCGANRWISSMMVLRPYRNREALLTASDRAFDQLSDTDWIEAFRHHPRIGEVPGTLSRLSSAADWAGNEQRGATGASEATKAALARRNRDYEARYGFVFIIYATGKTAEQMLTALEERMANDPETELEVAADEQKKITALRIAKLLDEDPNGSRRA